MKTFWRVWAKALGEKVLQAVICNTFIVWNIIKNWDD